MGDSVRISQGFSGSNSADGLLLQTYIDITSSSPSDHKKALLSPSDHKKALLSPSDHNEAKINKFTHSFHGFLTPTTVIRFLSLY